MQAHVGNQLFKLVGVSLPYLWLLAKTELREKVNTMQDKEEEVFGKPVEEAVVVVGCCKCPLLPGNGLCPRRGWTQSREVEREGRTRGCRGKPTLRLIQQRQQTS